MTKSIQRFLGFAFASADLLVELTPNGRVAFAVGAAKAVTGLSDEQIAGKTWKSMIARADHPMVKAVLDSLEDGVRRGPLSVELATPGETGRRMAALSACLLPGSENISCALSSIGGMERPQTDAAGFQSRDSFESLAEDLLQAAKVVGQELDFALIDTPGLKGALDSAGPEAAEAIVRHFSGALRAESFNGAPAARLGPERFAVIRAKAAEPDHINQRLSSALGSATGDESLQSCGRILGVDVTGDSLERSMRGLRYAMDQFVIEGAGSTHAANLTEAFNRSLRATLAKAGAIGEAIRDQTFHLAFQPIVCLNSGCVEHYEALVRFADEQSPFDLIRMAEELALIEQLDLAVASKVFDKIYQDRDRKLRLAVNVSGRSIEDPAFITDFQRITARHPDLIDRLIVEVTESSTIRDLKVANRNIQRLRKDGHKLCLDDFGAGANSISYLQALQVDVVKIDGKYVKDLAGDDRDAALVRHIVALCRELGVSTTAEMIESEAVEDAARRAGVECGQGYFYGKPACEPTPIAPRVRAKRKGTVESWG